MGILLLRREMSETTPVAIVNTNTSENDEWFDLNGRRLNDKSATRGLYIHNNQKVIVR